MRIISYLRSNGLKHAFEVIYQYKIDIFILKLLKPFLKNKPLQNIIVIESHNDFDSNGGTFYNYLIENRYNEKYKIVWLLKHKKPERLPQNVEAVPLYKPSIKKDYYKWIAKWFTSDNDCGKKLRSDQISIYFGHGGFGLKKFRGLIKIPANIDYVLMPSHYLSAIFADQMMLKETDPRLQYIGFPYVDAFYCKKSGDLKKITKHPYKKTILWMPTFRKGGGYKREDSAEIGKLGIPLIQDVDTYKQLNSILISFDILMIIKIHPMQDLSNLGIFDMSNIKVLTGVTVKTLEIDNYRLMKDCDAMVSDYSSAAFDFLHRNKPIAFDFSDLNAYKLGLAVENPKEFIAGDIIENVNDLFSFIKDVAEDRDTHYERRQLLRKKIFDYYDGDNCFRAVNLLGIEK